MVQFFRSHLAWKLFLSYVVVVLVGVVVLASAARFSLPSAYARHLAGMSAMMAGNSMMGNAQQLEQELFDGYQASVIEALSLATGAALIAAVLASFFISRQVVVPIQRMMALSRRIAEGEYSQRLDIAGDLQKNQVDELGQMALRFNQMADKLEKTETMRRQLLGDVSHELRTPLTGIKGYMEGLIDGVLPSTPETFQQVYREADRLQRLVNDLQELSRVEAGAFQLRIRPVAITSLMDTAVNYLKFQFEEKGIALEKSIRADLPNVMADPDRILQVLTNLIGNALQYTPSGGTVRIDAVQKQNEVQISITDTGIGIAADDLVYIFDRFYRADKSRARASGGSGIGLTVAQALVKAQHGRIWVESVGRGKGSTFFFTLPLSPDSQ